MKNRQVPVLAAMRLRQTQKAPAAAPTPAKRSNCPLSPTGQNRAAGLCPLSARSPYRRGASYGKRPSRSHRLLEASDHHRMTASRRTGVVKPRRRFRRCLSAVFNLVDARFLRRVSKYTKTAATAATTATKARPAIIRFSCSGVALANLSSSCVIGDVASYLAG